MIIYNKTSNRVQYQKNGTKIINTFKCFKCSIHNVTILTSSLPSSIPKGSFLHLDLESGNELLKCVFYDYTVHLVWETIVRYCKSLILDSMHSFLPVVM